MIYTGYKLFEEGEESGDWQFYLIKKTPFRRCFSKSFNLTHRFLFL